MIPTLKIWWCGLRGHADEIHFTWRRMFLRCSVCRRETAGWEMK